MNTPDHNAQMKRRSQRASTLQKRRGLRTGFQVGVLLALVAATSARATTYTYVGTGGSATTPVSDNFSTGFTPTLGAAGGTPVSTTADTLLFGGNAAYTATDDFGATVNANVLTFSNTAPISLARGTSGANSITLGGTTPTISLGNTANTALVTNNLDLVLANTITITGAGSMTLNGTINDGNNGYGLNMNGTGALTLNAATSFLGNTNLNYGNITTGASNVLSPNSALVFGTNTASTLQIGNTTQTVASLASFRYIQNQTIYGTTNGTGALTAGGNNATTTFYGRFDYVAFTKNGTGVMTISGNQQGVGSTLTLNAGTIILSQQGANYAFGNGATVNAGTLRLAGGTGDELYNGSLVTMTGGTFDLNGQTETIGGLVSTGAGTVTNTSATATAVLTVGGSTTTSNFAGTITDGASQATQLIKTGTGIQILSGANTYSGGTTISAGTLEFGAFASLPNSGTGTTVASGATLTVAVGGSGTTTSANVATLEANASFASGSFLGFDTTGGNFTESDNLTGAYGLNKVGANVLTLTGANSYTGPTTISAGTLAASGTVGTLPTSSAVSMVANTTLSLQNDSSGTIAQGNSITLASSGGATATTTIDVRNNGGGTTGSVVALGALNNGPATSAYSNAITFTGANGYTLNFTGLTLSGLNGGTTYLNPTTTSVTISSVTNQQTSYGAGTSSALVLDGTSTGNVITGAIADNPNHTASGSYGGNTNGATSISDNAALTGLGTTSVWTLTGQITYSGTTTVANGGALILNTPATSTSANTVAVNSGGTLMGNGYAPTGLLTVASGGNLAPGATAASTPTTAASVGVLHVGALTLNTTTGAGSNFNVLLGDNGSTTGAGAGTSYSQLDATGTVKVAGNLNLTLNGNLTVGDKFFILLNSGTNSTSGTFSNITGSSFTTGGDTFSISYAANGDSGTVSDDISLTVTAVAAVPEPSTYAGGLLTLAFGAWTLRRRRNRRSV